MKKDEYIESAVPTDYSAIVASEYRKLLRSIKVPLTALEKREIRAAYEMAVDGHKNQSRQTGEPYILHPIAVARICAEEMGQGAKAIIGALLHDVVEDTDYTTEDISGMFGENIANMVESLTKLDKAILEKDGQSNLSIQALSFRKILLTLAKDIRVVLIKMADRLHNLRTIDAMPHHKQLRVASETTYIYAPLAHRLGLYSIKSELEDLCLKITDKETYDFVVHKLEETEKDRNAYVKKFVAPLKSEINARFPDMKFNVFGRVKSITSIANKLRKKDIPFEDIYDIFAVRVVIEAEKEYEKMACWQVYSIITDQHIPLSERFKDWISVPKPNGYESLHITVMGPQGRFVEVQVRSQRMDELAERGVAAHWKYKGIASDNLFDQWLQRAREVLENPTSDAIDFLNDFKADLFAEEVYVFTPKGELRFFPKGATALDFAFDIHSDIGVRCHAVKVSGRIVPISYKLQNGDQLEVVTRQTQKPTEDWLNIVVTSRARGRIRQAIKDEKRKSAEEGKEILRRKLNSLKVNLDDNLEQLTKYYGFTSRTDFLSAIHNEAISLQELKNFKIEENKLVLFEKPLKDKDDKVAQVPVPVPSKTPMFKAETRLLIDGKDASTLSFELSPCCNPVQGDSIFAYVSTKNVFKIHRVSCVNAEHLQATFSYRVKKAEWVNSVNSSYVVTIRINGIDDLGVVQNLTSIITQQLALNMRSISLAGNEGYFEGTIGVVIKNTDQLNLLLRTLRAADGITSAVRLEQ